MPQEGWALAQLLLRVSLWWVSSGPALSFEALPALCSHDLGYVCVDAALHRTDVPGQGRAEG